MVLKNYIELQEGIPTRLHFIAHAIVTKEITDPLTGLPKQVKSLVFSVDRLDGIEILSSFSTVGEKLADQLWAYVKEGRYRGLEFTITKHGRGFQTRYDVAVRPFTG